MGTLKFAAENAFGETPLAAVSTLLKYVADLDEPFTHKSKVILASFGHQTHLDASNSH